MVGDHLERQVAAEGVVERSGDGRAGDVGSAGHNGGDLISAAHTNELGLDAFLAEVAFGVGNVAAGGRGDLDVGDLDGRQAAWRRLGAGRHGGRGFRAGACRRLGGGAGGGLGRSRGAGGCTAGGFGSGRALRWRGAWRRAAAACGGEDAESADTAEYQELPAGRSWRRLLIHAVLLKAERSSFVRL